MTILDAMRDRRLFGPWFKAKSWRPWFAFLAALFALPMDEEQLEIYRKHTDRTDPPAEPAREAWTIVGRRGGKSRIAALIAVYLACFRDYRPHLAPGEVATIAIIACDKKQARTVLRYVRGFLSVPMLAKKVVSDTKEGIELSNRVVIEIHVTSFRSTRGYSLAALIADEITFWRSEDSANPDREIINALKPGLGSIPGALLIAISSAYARTGVLWEQFDKYFGKDGTRKLVWRGETLDMNPAFDREIISEAYEEDEAAALAEYGSEFRKDIETFVSIDAVRAVTIPDRIELPKMSGCAYVAFTDPAGGSGRDSYTVAIAHTEQRGRERVVVLDLVREVKPPFSPERVTREFATLVGAYGIRSVTGDRYAGEWPREQWRKWGIAYNVAEKTASELYLEALPLITSRRCELLDHQRLFSQLTKLERRTGRGRDYVGHAPKAHDDVVNSALGSVTMAAERNRNRVGLAKIAWGG